jgi:hypothetical protein
MTKDEESQGVANAGAAETWSDENDPAGVAFDWRSKWPFSNWGRFLNGFVRL